MCKKQTSVSHNSTESEIISLDTGLRLDGLPALELWDLIVSVLGNISRISDRMGKPANGENKHLKSHNKIDAMKDIDSVPSNVQSANYCMCLKTAKQWSRWSLKEGGPTMTHVSRTHRVALDSLFDRINLDPKIQIKYIDTKTKHLEQKEFHTWWVEIICCSTRIRRRTCHTKSLPMMNLTAKTPSFVFSSASSNPGRTSYGYQNLFQMMIERPKLVEPVKTKLYTRGLWSILVFSRVEKWSCRARSIGNLRGFLGVHCKKLTLIVRKFCSDRNAHSARYGELIHDWTGKLVWVHHQEQAYF